MSATMQTVCPACGKVLQVPKSASDATYRCGFCGKPIRVLAHSSVNLQTVTTKAPAEAITGSPAMSGRLATVAGSGSSSRIGTQTPRPVATQTPPRIGTPTPPPGQVKKASDSNWASSATKDPEAAMLTEAWGAFREHGWQCQDWPGSKAFSTAGPLPGDLKKEDQDSASITVFVSGGVLCLETVVAPLPRPPLMPLRELIHRINVRSGGTFFLVRDCGVVGRFKLIPRKQHGDSLSKDGVMRAMRQLYYDRSNAKPLFKEEAIRVHLSSPASVNRAFLNPLGAGVTSPIGTETLLQLANLADFQANAKGAMLYVGKQKGSYPVWFSVSSGVLRGWTAPGSLDPAKDASVSWFRKIVSSSSSPLLPAATQQKVSRQQLDGLLKKLDEENESSPLLNYVWNGQQVLALATFPPTEKRMDPEEFKLLAGALFERAQKPLDILKGTALA